MRKLTYVFLGNRWRTRKRRRGDWILIGIDKRYSSPKEHSWRVSFLGFSCTFWFEEKESVEK